jgi:hypothetical protein
MSNKNPFEIRADMLKLAKDYMDQQYHMNVDFWRQQFEANKATAEEFQKAIQSYSMDDLMEKAKEMYSFVSTKQE